MVWPSDLLLSRRARWEDLTVVSYTACPADRTPCVKMSFSVSCPVRWFTGRELRFARPAGGVLILCDNTMEGESDAFVSHAMVSTPLRGSDESHVG